MPQLPALYLYTDAYLADTSHLTDAEHGRYFLLLIHLWRAPNQRLPNDEKWLARKFSRSVEAWREEMQPVVDEFCQSDGNWITQKKLSKVFKERIKTGQKNSDRANRRWKTVSDKPLENNETGPRSGNAGPAMQPEPEPYTLSETTSLREKRAREDDGFAEWWESYPHKVGKKSAEPKYRRIVQTGEATPEQLIAGLRRYVRDKPPDRPWCNPATWLNQGRWADEPAVASKGNGAAKPSKWVSV